LALGVCSVVTVVLLQLSIDGHADITFTRDVLPILQENCQACHRPNGANLGGMVAPMALTTYEETRPWAKAIAESVAAHKMPPWSAAPAQHGQFVNERTLGEAQIKTLVAWSNAGAPRGDPADAPPAREWPAAGGWSIGEPDLVLTPDKPFFVEDGAQDVYAYLKTTMSETLLPADRFIKAVELRPGSPAVHHIIAPPLGALTPGNDPTIYPDGVGVLLKKGADITWQMHYHKEPGPGTSMWDRSSAGIKFYASAGEVNYRVQGNDLGRYDFVIPPGEANYAATAEFTFTHDSQIVSFMPHFHLRGKSARYEAVYPDGTRETLLDVPHYDFNWQTTYQYGTFKKMPKGTKVVYTAVWDNSAANTFNPDPKQTVRWGEPTTDEMSYGYMAFINNSGENRSFFDNIRGVDGIDLVALVALSDKDRDGKMSKSEAPQELGGFFAIFDANNDGLIDMNEARAATQTLRAAGNGPR
jgi:hypothetical protein